MGCYRVVFLHLAVTQNRLARSFVLYFCSPGKLFMTEPKIYVETSCPLCLLEQNSAYA